MRRLSRESDKGTQSFNSIVQGNPQQHRRAADAQVFFLDTHDAGLVMVCLAIVLMSCLDAVFTLKLLAVGASEINYFMKILIDTNIGWFLGVKLLATCSGVVVLMGTARFRLGGILPVQRVLETICGIYSCLIIWELYLLTTVATSSL